MAWCLSKEGVAGLLNIPMSTWAITLPRILPIFDLLLSGKGLFILRMKRMVSIYFFHLLACNKAKKIRVNIMPGFSVTAQGIKLEPASKKLSKSLLSNLVNRWRWGRAFTFLFRFPLIFIST